MQQECGDQPHSQDANTDSRHEGSSRVGSPKIVCPHDECIPPLPVHFVGQEFLNTLPAPATSYSCAWHFQLNPKMPPILCVPCNFYHGYLMMIRV